MTDIAYSDQDRLRVRQDLQARFQADLPGMIDRRLAMQKIGIVGWSHFARALADARGCFVAGFYTASIMTAQAVCEGLAKLAAESAGAPTHLWNDSPAPVRERLTWLREAGFEPTCVDAFERVHGRNRNSFHHMNRNVPTDYEQLECLARQSMADLYALESWFFEQNYDNGVLRPVRRQYWPAQGEGLGAYLDLST